ncbi:MAG: sensor histidine kinase [Gammaproteobacteria bacterium]|nr:sensor histidine kinase [Gammaproteobacteria bacterium]
MRIVILFSLIVLISPLSVLADTIHIGLRAHSGAEKDMEKWQPTADYLSQKIPEHRFVMIPFEDINELSRAAGRNMFEFVLTNPSSYVDLEKKYGASRVLTLQNLRQGGAYTQFGSVIFTRQDNNEINHLNDIKGKRFMAVSERAFGGWRVAWKEFLDNDIDPYADFEQVLFSGGIQEQVVHAVLKEQADAGTVRTDMLESMAASGEIDLNKLKILNRKNVDNFPFLLSTQLYPEWPFAKFPHTSSELAQKIAIALLSMPNQHPAATKGNYYGWTVPLDYQPVHGLLQSLKVDAYSNYGEINLNQLLSQYWYIVLTGFLTLLISWMVTANILRTNRKLYITQQALSKSKQELELRVKERTLELENALGLAEEASTAKTHFLSRMSHELRTPMNAILGFSELILSNADESLSEENQDNITEIFHAGKHLLALINEVLELSQIESGRLKLKNSEVNLQQLVEECIQALRPLSSAKNLHVISNTNSCVAFTDATRVKQILINLLSNAIKYNHNDGSVNIECRKEDTNWIRISISNTGAGIAAADLDSIFEPFKRLKGNEGVEGTGIGLTVCKQLVEVLGGSIGVQSTNNGTTQFWFRLKTLLVI